MGCAMSSKVKLLCTIVVLCVAAGTFWAQEKKGESQASSAPSSTQAVPASPHNFTISPEDSARKNAVKFTEVSVERGKKTYHTQCALCHGDKGDGKGELATDMKLNLPDFTKPDALSGRTDGDLFAIVGTGKDPMPTQKGRMTDPQIWNLVNYLRALGGKVPEKTKEKAGDENVILVP